MRLTDRQIAEFQTIFKEEYGKEMTRAEAEESAQNLLGFFELLLKLAHQEDLRKKRLEKESGGFPLGGQGYTCMICRNGIPGGMAWYDQYGIKCPECQFAVNKRKLPLLALKDRDSFVTLDELKWRYEMKRSSINQLIRDGKLKARPIIGPNGKLHCRLFLLKENPTLMAR